MAAVCAFFLDKVPAPYDVATGGGASHTLWPCAPSFYSGDRELAQSRSAFFSSPSRRRIQHDRATLQDQARIMATGVDAKLLKSTKFPPEFNQKVDMQKVNLQVMKKYVRSPSPRVGFLRHC